MVTMQAPVPLHAPPQPVNDEPSSGVAVSVTSVPAAKPWAQSLGQLIPVGTLVTDPSPVPIVSTASL